MPNSLKQFFIRLIPFTCGAFAQGIADSKPILPLVVTLSVFVLVGFYLWLIIALFTGELKIVSANRES